MSERLDYQKNSPELFKKFAELNFKIDHSSIEKTILDLVFIRTSQINGCAFCLDMHSKQATLHGERALRLYTLAAWRESVLFNPRERAALAWAEALARLAPEGVSDELYQYVRTQFSEQEISDLTFAVMAINGWNRANIAFTPVPGSLDKQYGLDKANLA